MSSSTRQMRKSSGSPQHRNCRKLSVDNIHCGRLEPEQVRPDLSSWNERFSVERARACDLATAN